MNTKYSHLINDEKDELFEQALNHIKLLIENPGNESVKASATFFIEDYEADPEPEKPTGYFINTNNFNPYNILF